MTKAGLPTTKDQVSLLYTRQAVPLNGPYVHGGTTADTVVLTLTPATYGTVFEFQVTLDLTAWDAAAAASNTVTVWMEQRVDASTDVRVGATKILTKGSIVGATTDPGHPMFALIGTNQQIEIHVQISAQVGAPTPFNIPYCGWARQIG